MRGSRTLRAAAMAAVLSFGAVFPSVAWARDEALAEQLFSEGLAAMKAERWAAACEAFLGSNQADPSAGTEINLGVCNEKQKKYATALVYYEAAARRAEAGGRADRAKFARSEYERVAALVHHVQIALKTPVEGATITRDGGEPVSASLVVSKPVNVDPGKHTFELAAKGKKPVSKEVSIPETAGTTSLEFPPMEDAPIDPKTGAPADGSAGSGTVVVTSDGSTQRTVGIVVGGVGILALLTAVGVQLLALSEDSKAKEFQQKVDDPNTSSTDRTKYQEAQSTRKDAAKNDQLIAIITGAGGVVMIGVGAVLFFTAPSGKPASSGKPKVLPVVGPGYAGASLGFSF